MTADITFMIKKEFSEFQLRNLFKFHSRLHKTPMQHPKLLEDTIDQTGGNKPQHVWVWSTVTTTGMSSGLLASVCY